ncbi:MAG: GIY-YIG nuclease family protein [Acidobacteriia bacterium]|nr:GIY-YIG nuclease family protein [Terriglobia bacterium]
MSRVSGKPYFVYILWSASGQRFYIGIGENPDARLRQHNDGTSRGWTSRHRPWELVHREVYADYRLARQRELLLKKQKGGNGLFELTGLDRARFRRGS